jgi:hypothetical protein
MTVATAFAVSWKPLTNSKPSAISSATPNSRNGSHVVIGAPESSTSCMQTVSCVSETACERSQKDQNPKPAPLALKPWTDDRVRRNDVNHSHTPCPEEKARATFSAGR